MGAGGGIWVPTTPTLFLGCGGRDLGGSGGWDLGGRGPGGISDHCICIAPHDSPCVSSCIYHFLLGCLRRSQVVCDSSFDCQSVALSFFRIVDSTQIGCEQSSGHHFVIGTVHLTSSHFTCTHRRALGQFVHISIATVLSVPRGSCSF